jgi:hypothetical protein
MLAVGYAADAMDPDDSGPKWEGRALQLLEHLHKEACSDSLFAWPLPLGEPRTKTSLLAG